MYRYGGESNVPGAPGNLMAGSPGYFMPDASIQDQLFRYGMDRTPAGQQMKERIRGAQQKFNIPGGGMQGMVPMGNAGFYMGPQYDQQMPPGFHGKTVS
jgi:hypothetical protein